MLAGHLQEEDMLDYDLGIMYYGSIIQHLPLGMRGAEEEGESRSRLCVFFIFHLWKAEISYLDVVVSS